MAKYFISYDLINFYLIFAHHCQTDTEKYVFLENVFLGHSATETFVFSCAYVKYSVGKLQNVLFNQLAVYDCSTIIIITNFKFSNEIQAVQYHVYNFVKIFLIEKVRTINFSWKFSKDLFLVWK